MPKRTVQIALPGAQTEAGRQRIMAAAAKRDQVDFQCFRLLHEMDQMGLTSEQTLLEGTKREVGYGVTLTEAREQAEHFAGRVSEMLQRRDDANNEFIAALHTQDED